MNSKDSFFAMVLKKEREKNKKNNLNDFYSNLSYISYLVEKNTNITVTQDTNLVMVWDRYNCIIYENELKEKAYNKK